MEREAKDQSLRRASPMDYRCCLCSWFHWCGGRWHHGWLCQWVKAWTRVSFHFSVKYDFIANNITAKPMQRAVAAHRSLKLA